MYGVCISIAILISAIVAEYLLVTYKYISPGTTKFKGANHTTAESEVSKSILWGAVLCTIIGGIVGARIYHVIHLWTYYQQDPIRILQVQNGGLGILGGLVGGTAALMLYLKLKKQPITPWVDLAAVVIPLGQAIGRVGNFFNRELYGLPTQHPWGIYIPPEKRVGFYYTFSKYHPLFLYEAILNLLLFAILYKLYTKKTFKPSSYFFIYLGGYSVIRFCLEFFRIDSWHISGLNVAQTISILVTAISIIALVRGKVLK